MSAVAVSIDSRDCKTPGCAGEAAWARGPYAGLCTACTATQKRRLSAIQRENAARTTPEERSARAHRGHETRRSDHPSAPRVRNVLRDVEKAVTALDRARAAELKAADAYRAARRAVADAEQKVAAVRAVLDQAIAGEPEDAS